MPGRMDRATLERKRREHQRRKRDLDNRKTARQREISNWSTEMQALTQRLPQEPGLGPQIEELQRKIQEAQQASQGFEQEDSTLDAEQMEIDAQEATEPEEPTERQEPSADEPVESTEHDDDQSDEAIQQARLTEAVDGMTLADYRQSMGIVGGGTAIGWKPAGARGSDTVFARYGAVSYAKYKLEPASETDDLEYKTKAIKFTDDKTRIGEMKINDEDGNKKWKYGRHNATVKLLGVAWRYNDTDGNALNLIDPAMKHRLPNKRFPETQCLLEWDIRNEGKKRSIETRTTTTRVFSVNKKAGDDAIFRRAKTEFLRFERWNQEHNAAMLGDSQEATLDSYAIVHQQSEAPEEPGERRRRIPSHELPTPRSAISFPTPAPAPDGSGPTAGPTATTATSNGNGQTGGQTLQQAKQEFLSAYCELMDKTLAEMNPQERSEAVAAWMEEKRKRGL